MSYIGQGLPADTFQGFVTDSFTGDGSATTFTLSKEPFSEDTLIVVINNVIQKPTTNFTVSGTTLTIVGTAVADGDVIYAIHMGGPLPIGGAAELDLNGASDKLILDADADTTISADTDDQIDFKTGGTDRLTIQSTSGNNVVVADGLTLTDGNLIVASGHGIDFSATGDGSGTTASELFDDYEEGTFTPSYTSTGATFTAYTSFGLSTGHYTKVGNVVYCRIQVSTNGASGGTASNNVEIQGLPFTVTDATNKDYASSIIVSFDWAGDHPYGGLADANTTKVNLYYRDAADGAGANRVNYGDMNTGSGPVNSVYLTVWYHVD